MTSWRQGVIAPLLALMGAGFFGGVLAETKTYPQRPIRLIVPFTPGGGTDIVSRYLAQKMTEGLRQQIVIDNRGGAGGTIGTEIAVRASPDGYTIVMVSASYTVNPALYKFALRNFLTINKTAKISLRMLYLSSRSVST